MKKILVVLGVLGLLAGIVNATEGPFDQYVGSATVVAKGEGQPPLVDQGKVICNKSSGMASIGGGCVLFGPWDSIQVNDAVQGNRVAFQVCIDNNGDSLCGGRQGFDPCGDDIFFSHDDHGNFFNPLGKLPTFFRPGCPGGPWKGYVVFICEGVHNAGTAHQHSVTTGSITGTVGGTGFGDFCSPPEQAPPKEYEVH